MTKITRIGIDLGKSTFHVCGVDRHGQVVVEKKFTRRGLERFMAEQPPCLVGLEACGGAHHSRTTAARRRTAGSGWGARRWASGSTGP